MKAAQRAEKKPRLFILLGPTCTGKTSVVNALLERYQNVHMVCFDSYQLYDHFALGTGRSDSLFPGRAHLYGFAEPTEELSVESYMELLFETVEKIIAQGGIPILEGGSRRYLSVLSDLAQRGLVELDVVGVEPPDSDYMERRYVQRTAACVEHGILEEMQRAIDAGYGDSFLMQNYEVYEPFTHVLKGGSVELAQQQVVERVRGMHNEQMRVFKQYPFIQWYTVTAPDLLDQVSAKFEAYAGHYSASLRA